MNQNSYSGAIQDELARCEQQLQSLAGKRVYVGLSGGVDSTVTAALVQRAGAQVTGVFIRGWYPEGMPCTWKEDRVDAMRAAARLGIPFITLDARDAYKKGVIDYLLEEYRAGRTPNPDIMCNRDVKFGAFYCMAREAGADYIATGHYAQVRSDALGNGTLVRGTDEAKDQSYFLWAVPQGVLAHVLFPIGSLTKPTVRAIAEQLQLPNATRADSQGICFLGSVDIASFLRSEFGEQPGEARDTDGELVGTHDGVLLHTIGSRIALTDAVPGPWYVIAKDIATNVITVSKQRTALHSATNAHEISEPAPISLISVNMLIAKNEYAHYVSQIVTAQYRYHGPLIEGKYDIATNSFIPTVALPEAIASGQSLVLYAGSQCLGGGIIA